MEPPEFPSTPSSLPQRQLLAAQAAAYLNAEIDAGKWTQWLPSERRLANDLQISRNTVRAALAILQRDGRVAPEHGAGNRILSPRPEAPARPALLDVGFICPEPLRRLRPHVTLWIDGLRALLSERGCRVRVFHGPQYFRQNAGPALRRLTDQNPHGCWVLVLSSQPMQRWFARSGLPCVVAGTCHPGVTLPYVDLDHRAMCRHAAGVLLGLGHRRIGFIYPKMDRAGDQESIDGFLEGVRASRQPGVEPTIVSHDGTPDGIIRVLRRLMGAQNRPTALIVANPYSFLTVATWLAESGRKLPRDVSLLSRDDDPFLSFLVPAPARYSASADVFARNVLRSVLALLHGGADQRAAVRIMPEFIRGSSLHPLDA